MCCISDRSFVMPSYKLYYFNARGRGEVARLLFAAAEETYEDIRLTKEEWADFKSSTPFGQLPVLEVDNVLIAQSNAIYRFLAKRFGLLGKTDEEAAHADMIVDALVDLHTRLNKECPFDKDYDKNKTAQLGMTCAQQIVVESLNKLEKLLISNNGGDGYFVGDELTWADIVFIDQIAWVPIGSGPEVLWGNFPKLRALKDRVEGRPRIAEWLQKRPILQI